MAARSLDRACIWIRLLFALLAAMALRQYTFSVTQARGQVIGFCPVSATGALSLMVYDSRGEGIYCVPLPPPDPMIVEPKTGME